MTVQNCYDYFANITDGEEIDEALFLVWINAINKEAYQEMYNLFPEKYTATKNFSSIVGEQNYAFVDIGLLDFNSFGTSKAGIYILKDGVIVETLPYTEWGTDKRGFYLEDNKIVLTPTPKKVEDFSIRYIKSISGVTGNASNEITDMGDDLVLPAGFEDFVGEEIMIRYWKKEEETELMQNSDNFAKRFKNRLTTLDEYKPYAKTTIKTPFF